MLAYEPESRPNAGQVVELMEALAEEVQDGSVRRFCREVVLPCHQAMEYPDNPDDPFMGSTLFEDTTRVRDEVVSEDSGLQGLNVGPAPTLDAAKTIESGPTRTPRVGEVVVSDAIAESHTLAEATTKDDLLAAAQESEIPEITTGSLPELPTDIADADQVAEMLGTASPDAPAPTVNTRRSGIIAGFVIAFSLVLLVGSAYVAWKYLGQPPPAPEVTEVPAGRTYGPGGEVDAGFEGKVGRMSMGLKNATDARVTISGNQNEFTYRWNGQGDLTIVNLEPGLYRVRIVDSSNRVNLESRVIKRRTCTYEYNLTSGTQEWTEDGCN